MNREKKRKHPKTYCKFFNDAADGDLKKLEFLLKEGTKRSTIYYTIQWCSIYKTTNDLPRIGWPMRLSNGTIARLVGKIDNKTSFSQRRLTKQYDISPSTTSRTIRQRTNVRAHERTKVPKSSKE